MSDFSAFDFGGEDFDPLELLLGSSGEEPVFGPALPPGQEFPEPLLIPNFSPDFEPENTIFADLVPDSGLDSTVELDPFVVLDALFDAEDAREQNALTQLLIGAQEEFADRRLRIRNTELDNTRADQGRITRAQLASRGLSRTGLDDRRDRLVERDVELNREELEAARELEAASNAIQSARSDLQEAAARERAQALFVQYALLTGAGR